jgi:hypothetical protein
MITDIYIKHENDPGYNAESIVEQEEIQILLAQIKMTLMTPKNSVLGENQYGVDEDKFLFTFSNSFDTIGIENTIRTQLQDHCTLLKNRNWTAKAYIMPDGIDQNRDAIHIMLTIDESVRFVIAYS